MANHLISALYFDGFGRIESVHFGEGHEMSVDDMSEISTFVQRWNILTPVHDGAMTMHNRVELLKSLGVTKENAPYQIREFFKED